MKNKNFFYYLKYPFINYKFLSFTSLVILLYAGFDVAKSYLKQNTKTIKADNPETCRTDTLPFCNISDDFQFSNFIFLALDGISFHYIQPLLDYFGKNVHLYTTFNNLNRFTLPIFRTWLTGRDSINVIPFAIDEDTIMHCYNRTYGIKLYLAGNARHFKAENLRPEHTIFAGGDYFRNTKKISRYRAYRNWLYDNNRLNNVLNLVKNNKYSVLAYDDKSDHVQHSEGYGSLCTDFTLSEQIPKKLAEDIHPIKEFIDNNKDYVLIISSDHGHDEIFYDNKMNNIKLPYLASFTPEAHYSYYDHGGYITNNTGWWLFYSPLLSPSHRLMNVTDVASTWMKYIKNVDIPANSVGRPMNSMRYIRNEIKVKQQGLAQLWNLCRKSTKYCKGNVYEEGLKWKEGEVKKIDKERNEKKETFLNREKKDIKERELELVKKMVSMNADEVFPCNLSVDELRRISEGRDKEPRRKEKQNITTVYYYEYDMDEEGNLYDNLKEKNEEMNISKEEAKEIIDKYDLFVNETEILHGLLYDTSIVIKHSDYYQMGSNIKIFSLLIFYSSYFADILLFSLIIRNYCKHFLKVHNNDNSKSVKEKSMKSYSFYLIILLFFIILYSRDFYISFSRMKTLMNYLSQPEISIIVFRYFDLFLPLYSIVAIHIVIYSSLLLILIFAKLIVLYKRYKNNIDNSNNKTNSSHSKSFFYFIFHPSSFIYSFYINPLLKLIVSLMILPLISSFLHKIRRIRRNDEKYNKLLSSPTLSTIKISRIMLYISLFDVSLSVIRVIIYICRDKEEKKEENDIKEKEKERLKKRGIFWDLFDRICIFIIFYNFVKWTEPDNKKVFFMSCDVNMLIISSFTFIITVSEFLKNKKNINIKTEKSPSLLNFKTEFISSWSIIESFKSCIADSSYLLFYFIFISLFLSDRPLHLPLFLCLSLFLLYVLLPLINALVTRISFFVIYKDKRKKEKKESKENKEETEEEGFINNNSNHICNNNLKDLVTFLVDLIEIFLCFLIIHLVVEYICFSIYGWLYAAGENSFFNFVVDRTWIGIEDMENSYVFTSIYMVVVKAGFYSVLFFCSAYVRDIGRNIKNKITARKEEDNEHVQTSFLINKKEGDKEDKKDDFVSKFFYSHVSLLFIPLPLSFLLQIVSLFLLSFVGSTIDLQKQNHYLIYALIQLIGSVTSLLPLLF